MKAIRVHKTGEPDVLQYEEIADPEVRTGQVLLRIRAAGVNPFDTYIRAGRYAQMPSLPYIPGVDAAGVVEAVASGVRRPAVGDRVYTVSGTTRLTTGCYAELLACDADLVRPFPPSLTFAQGASIGIVYATAVRALHQKAHAVPGETVLIHGASGGVGLAAVQLARAHGLWIIATAGTERGRRLAAEQGAHHILDHSQPDYLNSVMEVTGGRGANVILEMLANVNLAKDLSVVARFGRIVVIGNRGTVEINPRDAMVRDATISGLVLWNCSEAELFSLHAAIGAGLATGVLHPVVGREFPLREAAQAHVQVMAPGAYGKIVLVP
ncbi:MAG TPA: NADPH:quinone reductase [Candidatus Sulfotelmatobacter sp.]|nr:NADPH:quinone reductase [Candidatus Sulfotelmatobacter sp.]